MWSTDEGGRSEEIKYKEVDGSTALAEGGKEGRRAAGGMKRWGKGEEQGGEEKLFPK